jgi:iron-sulfur cluster assembly protein
MQNNEIITISQSALERVEYLLSQKNDENICGIRVGVKKGGCSGFEYVIEYASEIGKYDEIVEKNGVKIVIDPKAVMYLIGTTMDYVEEKIKSGFVFINPNEKGRCGCGESFHV